MFGVIRIERVLIWISRMLGGADQTGGGLLYQRRGLHRTKDSTPSYHVNVTHLMESIRNDFNMLDSINLNEAPMQMRT